MDRATTRQTLSQLIQSRTYGVIALTGDWGVGKTHLWKDLAKENGISHGYVSLFGLKSANEIKTRLASSRVRLDETEGVQLRRSWKTISAALSSALDKFTDANGVVGATAAVVTDLAGDRIVARILSGAVVVLDDLERSDPSLSMEEVMGAVDDLRRLNCQVLLILNDKQLADRAGVWQTFHEKVVDIQLALQITPADAIDAVLSTAAVERQGAIRDAWVLAGCRNIRVAQRAIRADRTIFRNRDTGALERLIADTVFLTIAEARAFHKEADSVEILSVLTGALSSNVPEIRAMREAIRASAPVDFSIYRSFQEAVIAFLKTGQIDEDSWDRCIDEAIADVSAGSTRQRLANWIETALWDPTTADDVARKSAEQWFPEVWRLDPRNAQAFIYALKEIGAHDLVDPFVAAWCQGINENQVVYGTRLHFEPVEPIDPRILQAIEQLALVLHPLPSLHDALQRQTEQRDFQEIDVAAINAAKEDDWARYLLSAQTKLPFNLAFKLLRVGGNDTSIGKEALRVALRNICQRQPESKLARVIIRSNILPPSAAE